MNITVLHMAYCSISVHNELDCDHVHQVFLNQHYAKNERVTIFFLLHQLIFFLNSIQPSVACYTEASYLIGITCINLVPYVAINILHSHIIFQVNNGKSAQS